MRASLFVAAVLFLAGCAEMPKTSEQAFRRSRVVRQPEGGSLVVGPEIPFTVRGKHGVTSFQAVVKAGRVVYYQTSSLAGLPDAGTFETPRETMERYRRTGASFGVAGTSVRVNFPPAYLEGFMRRVESVAPKP